MMKKLIILISILILGSFLYLYKIGEVPSGLGLDEAPNGVNAYSILQTGKDEFGKSFPISFRFSSSYSPPLYTYLSVPVIWLLGLNIASVRIISVISGIISIVVLFLLLKNLNIIQNKLIIYLGALLYTISPWVIMYSRSGYEGMLSFLIYSLGALFIWEGFKKPIYLTFGTIILSLSMYASHTNKFLAPLFLICLILVFKHILLNKNSRRYLFWGLIGAFLFQLPNLSLVLTQSFFVKSNLFYSENILSQYQGIKNIIPSFIGIPYLFIREFLSQYFTYFSLRSLFLDPDPFPGRSIPDLSVFYPWMFIPFLVGMFIVWKKRAQASYKYLLILTLTAPIPASLTKDPFWTYRAIPLLAPLIIIITIGIEKISKLLSIKFLFFLCCLVVIHSLLLLVQGYFLFLPIEREDAWQYGYQNLAKEVIMRSNDHFVIDNTRSPLTYLQLAFFMKLPPQILQNAANEKIKQDYYNDIIINSDYSFENIAVRSIAWKTDVYKNQILVGDNLTFSDKQIKEHELTQVFQIKDSRKNIIFEGYRTNPLKKCSMDKAANHILNPLCK